MSGRAVRIQPQRWWAVHRGGDTGASVSGASFASHEEARSAHAGSSTYIGAISSAWLVGLTPPDAAGIRAMALETAHPIVERLRWTTETLQAFLDTFGDLGDRVTAADINDTWEMLRSLAAAPGAGWRFDMENAPKDGRLIIVPGGVAYWKLEAADITGNDEGGRWYTVTGEAFPGLPIEWKVDRWLPFPPDATGTDREEVR